MIKIGPSEWMWRFLAVAMLFTLGWLMWVLYQLNPPPLILNAAFEASAKAKSKEAQSSKASVRGLITPPAAGAEPPKPVAELPKPVADTPPAAEPAKPAPEAPAEAKPVAAKPNEAEVIETVKAWSRAWSSKNVNAYLAYYAKDFKTPGGEPRGVWEKNRRVRIDVPLEIAVTIDSPSVSAISDDVVKVSFRQGYRSDITALSSTTKTLVMARTDGRWLIQQEIAGN